MTRDIEVRIPEGVPDNVVQTFIEFYLTLKFESQGYENERFVLPT